MDPRPELTGNHRKLLEIDHSVQILCPQKLFWPTFHEFQKEAGAFDILGFLQVQKIFKRLLNESAQRDVLQKNCLLLSNYIKVYEFWELIPPHHTHTQTKFHCVHYKKNYIGNLKQDGRLAPALFPPTNFIDRCLLKR